MILIIFLYSQKKSTFLFLMKGVSKLFLKIWKRILYLKTLKMSTMIYRWEGKDQFLGLQVYATSLLSINFYLWDPLKQLAYSANIPNEEIFYALEIMAVIERVQHSMIHISACRIFEHLFL